MSHELNKEELSAYMDGELPPSRQAELVVHLKACADCAGYVERLMKAKADFKTHGLRQAPAAAQPAAPKRHVPKKVLVPLLLAVLLGLFVLTEKAFKKFMPGLFQQIQGMISGAANDLGK